MKRFFSLVVIAVFSLSGCTQSKKPEAETLIMMFDAAGECYNCDKIVQSNFDKAASFLQAEMLRQKRVHAVYTGVFSKNTQIEWGALFPRRGSDRSRYKRLSKNSMLAVEKARKAIQRFYAYKDASGQEKLFPRDVYGAIKATLRFIKDHNLQKVHIVLFSNMKQSFNKKSTMKALSNNHIVLPEGVTLEIYAKSLICDQRGSQAQKEKVLSQRKAFWQSVIEPSSQVQYFIAY
jgi:hypothetical protein